MQELMAKVTTPTDEDSDGALTIKVWATNGEELSAHSGIVMAIRTIEGLIGDTTDITVPPKEYIKMILDSSYKIDNVLGDGSKFPVRLSNLSMRFYKKDGWKEEALAYFSGDVTGELIHTFDKGTDEEYYVYDEKADVNASKLAKHISKVIPGFKEQTVDIAEAVEGYIN